MKRSILVLSLAACLAAPAWAQDSSSDTPPPPPPHHGWGANLTEDERAELKSAHEAAIQANPDLETEGKQLHEQMEAFQKKMRDAMIKADPKVEAILAKMPHHHGPPPPDGGPGGNGGGPGE